MQKNQQAEVNPVLMYNTNAAPEKEFMFYIPPGVKFDDIYMNAEMVAAELKTSVKTVHNMRKAGLLSYTLLNKSILYSRQEIAGMLKANTVIGRNSWFKKSGMSG
jgi:hypothetical protein